MHRGLSCVLWKASLLQGMKSWESSFQLAGSLGPTNAKILYFLTTT